MPSVFSDFDLYLFGQGKHYRIYEKMGAHLREVDPTEQQDSHPHNANQLAGGEDVLDALAELYAETVGDGQKGDDRNACELHLQ